jgi:uncharacterized membrane protein
MRRSTAQLAAAGVGAAVMYWLDPQSGKRRRAEARNQAVHAIHRFNAGADVVSRDASNRLHGALAHLSSVLRSGPVDDSKLVARARSALGRVTSHAHAIQIVSRNGCLDLKGSVLESDHRAVLCALSRVRGVKQVDDHLGVHHDASGARDLQGAPRPRRHVPELLQENWSPSARLLVGIGGTFALVMGMRRPRPIGALAALIGSGFVLRSATNLPIKRAFGIGPSERVVSICKTIEIDAPVGEVFDACNAFEIFPRFMRHVRRITRSAEGKYHWTVSGPAGFEVEWDAVVTRMVPGKILAWRTEPGATVAHAGVIHFDPTRNGGTRLDIRMSYRPPAGTMGHVLAKLLGADPKKQMDDDLVRLKSLLEQGKATGREETVYADEIRPG